MKTKEIKLLKEKSKGMNMSMNDYLQKRSACCTVYSNYDFMRRSFDVLCLNSLLSAVLLV